MNRRLCLAAAAATSLLLTGCGVHGQNKPERINEPSQSPTPTPSLQQSTCPTPRTTPPTAHLTPPVVPPSAASTTPTADTCQPTTATSATPTSPVSS